MSTQNINTILSQALIRYSQVWEDDLILRSGLGIHEDDCVLSIASAGCNALSMLLSGAHQVVAVDVNPAQIALVQLKKTAITHCTLSDYRILMGVDAGNAASIYQSIRRSLPEETAAFWDQNTELFSRGIIHTGKLDHYFQIFEEQCIRKLIPQEALHTYLQSEDTAEQDDFFERYLTHPRFVEVFKQYTSKDMIASYGRDPAQFAYVTQQDTGSYFYERFRYVCTQIPARNNFYLHYLLTGGYPFIAPPQYREDEFQLLTKRIERLDIRHEGLLETLAYFPEHHFSKANLSDLFEYLSDEETQDFLSQLASRMRPSGIIAYWNLLVARESKGISALSKEDSASVLHKQDRCFFYSRFLLESIANHKTKED